MPESGQEGQLGLSPAGRKIIAVIPCFNTGKTIREVVTQVRRYVDRVVVINDGSTDDTAEVAASAGADVVNHTSRLGYAETVRDSFQVAGQQNADVMITIDGDAQHNPREIVRLISPILSGEADMVVGSRFFTAVPDPAGDDYAGLMAKIEPLQPRLMPAYRRFGIHLITWLFNMGYTEKLTDAQSGFRAFNRKALAVSYPREKGMGVSVEILARARERALRIREVPVTCIYHRASSTRNPVTHGLEVIFVTVKLKLCHIPLKRGQQ